MCYNHTLLFNCRYSTAVSRNTTCRRGGHRHHQVSSPSSTPGLNPIPVWILPQTIIVSCVWNHDNSLAADQETRNPNPDSGETWLLTECGRHGCPTLDMSSSPSARVDYVGSRRWHFPFAGLHQRPDSRYLRGGPCQLGRWSCHAMASRSGWGDPFISVLLGFDSSLPTLGTVEPWSISQPSRWKMPSSHILTYVPTYEKDQQTYVNERSNSHISPLHLGTTQAILSSRVPSCALAGKV